MKTSICGKILRVSLSNRSISCEEPDDNFYRSYFGGTGFTGYFLLKETQAGIDPLGPENKLIFSAGPLTGVPFPGSGRHSIGAKSPLTNAFGDSQAGGYWGRELKRNGLDAIIVEGVSENPVYLVVCDDTIEIREASDLWGLNGKATIDRIHQELGSNKARVAYIGPAGENLVKYACIGHDLKAFAGRCGLGAVMGSKRLKAIALMGTKRVQMYDKQRISELARQMTRERLSSGWSKMLGKYGTSALLPGLSQASGCPTRNFREGSIEGVENLSGAHVKETVMSTAEGCYACPVKCKHTLRISQPSEIAERFNVPEYETLAALGSCCGVTDIIAVSRGNQLCSEYGLDTISTGVSIAFAMECYENGILTKKETDGLELTFGNAEVLLELIDQIAHRRGLGDLLAEGVMRASETIGRGSEKYAMHVKGQELPMHDPRLKHAIGVGYAVSPTGADHCHSMHDTKLVTEASIEDWKALGVLKPPELHDLGPDKMRLATHIMNWEHCMNSLVICRFVPWSILGAADLVRSSTGWNASTFELMLMGERAATMARIYNIREGFSSKDDIVPKRLLQSFTSGPLKGVAIEVSTFQQAVKYYYESMGWTEDGVPTVFTLHRLGIPWAKVCLGL